VKAQNIRFRFQLADGEQAAAVAAGDTLERFDGGWVVTFAGAGRRVWVPDTNVLEVLL
jgi:hypothetical protein